MGLSRKNHKVQHQDYQPSDAPKTALDTYNKILSAANAIQGASFYEQGGEPDRPSRVNRNIDAADRMLNLAQQEVFNDGASRDVGDRQLP